MGYYKLGGAVFQSGRIAVLQAVGLGFKSRQLHMEVDID